MEWKLKKFLFCIPLETGMLLIGAFGILISNVEMLWRRYECSPFPADSNIFRDRVDIIGGLFLISLVYLTLLFGILKRVIWVYNIFIVYAILSFMGHVNLFISYYTTELYEYPIWKTYILDIINAITSLYFFWCALSMRQDLSEAETKQQETEMGREMQPLRAGSLAQS